MSLDVWTDSVVNGTNDMLLAHSRIYSIINNECLQRPIHLPAHCVRDDNKVHTDQEPGTRNRKHLLASCGRIEQMSHPLGRQTLQQPQRIAPSLLLAQPTLHTPSLVVRQLLHLGLLAQLRFRLRL